MKHKECGTINKSQNVPIANPLKDVNVFFCKTCSYRLRSNLKSNVITYKYVCMHFPSFIFITFHNFFEMYKYQHLSLFAWMFLITHLVGLNSTYCPINTAVSLNFLHFESTVVSIMTQDLSLNYSLGLNNEYIKLGSYAPVPITCNIV